MFDWMKKKESDLKNDKTNNSNNKTSVKRCTTLSRAHECQDNISCIRKGRRLRFSLFRLDSHSIRFSFITAKF